ncbi:SCO family protein [Pseudoduganella violaceinigra]|uniref:SCO family protein n=1 Tax=Pseudoduganella violaceinigra TaxID=246602 RepID=UPI001B7FAE4F|nr:SCO family protein [Pseudoduganella violaceinigra]
MEMKISPSSPSRPTSADLRRTAALIALMLAAAGLALYQATMGLRVVSTEEGRRLAIAEAPLALPRTTLAQPGAGHPVTLQALLAADGRPAIVTFFYARCNAVCSAQGSELQQIQRDILARGLKQKVRLLSISFDARDTPADLALYAERMRADPEIWQFAAVPDAAQLQSLLEQIGITVLPAELGEFQHNAAFHLVSASGKLQQVVDYEQPDAALRAALGPNQ